jgi:hypothetical protein
LCHIEESIMRFVFRLTFLGVCLGLVGLAGAQQSKDKASTAESIVAQMMAFDKNKDGKLSRDEITDRRLLRVFERADANKDGVVTKEELTAEAKRMSGDERGNGGKGRGFGPPDGPGGPGGGGKGGPGGGGPGGPGRFAGPPQPGQLLPPFLQETLKMSAEQKKQLAELQKEIDDKLAKILNDEQKRQLKEMRERFRPGGPPRPPQ